MILELDPQTQRDTSSLDDLYVRANNGALVPMSSFATLTSGAVGPLSGCLHSGQLWRP